MELYSVIFTVYHKSEYAAKKNLIIGQRRRKLSLLVMPEDTDNIVISININNFQIFSAVTENRDHF